MIAYARTLASCLLALVTTAGAHDPEPNPSAELPYLTRGHQVESHQRAYHEQLERLYRSLSKALRKKAPHLLPLLTPPRQYSHGYGVLPKIAPDVPPPSSAKRPGVVTFSWARSEAQIDQEMDELARLETELAELTASKSGDRTATYEALATDYRKAGERRRKIDSDVDYNWLWQGNIARDRELFDRLEKTQEKVLERNRLQDALDSNDETGLLAAAKRSGLNVTTGLDAARPLLEEQERSLSAEISAETRGVRERDFLRIEPAGPETWSITLPFYTDITDPAFVEEFRQLVEEVWCARASRNGNGESRVRLDIKVIAPDDLYCNPSSDGSAAESCAAPTPGTPIDLEAHVARFPPDRAVLTTGATTLRLIDDRAIVLGPYDVTRHVLAHELGHVLGFPDTYFRGYRDLGADGFQVTELADSSDIMGAPGYGPVLPRHFEGLVLAKARGQLNRSLQLFREERFAEAIDAARQALALKGDYAEAYNNIAAAYIGLGLWDESIEAAKQALAFKPDLQLARNNLEWAEAQRAKSSHPTDPR